MKLTFLTHATPAYERQYRALERSIRRHEPDADIVRMNPPGETDGHTYLPGLPRTRFVNALELLNQGAECVVQIGADCVLFQPLNLLSRLPHDNTAIIIPNVIISSHINHPCNDSNKYYATGLAQGDFNIFVNTPQTKKILQWLIDQDSDTDDKANGKFFEQPLLTTLPFIFQGVHILRDDTINVAWYNLHEREMEFVNEKFYVNKQPLTMFHFSGYEPHKPDNLSHHASIVQGNYAITELINFYANEMLL